ncbi:hypothetical protein HK105_205931 [Polyrhizophydium stewartii]|uniref:Matrin-type domain-containing protein n=1 Tax=Polyrhizophydium stewartii TaxID=2732419 RepID=A0ABR4N4Y9_9FUNG|nr:hypothetical protein HK105_000530 [Polyrhizophydium stewartii]
MSDYWVSGKKYFCDFCRIYIQDNKASRQAHETGNRHKNNVARHLRGVHKEQDIKVKEEARTQRMLAQVERSALKQYGQDLAQGGFKPDTAAMPAAFATGGAFLPPRGPPGGRGGRDAGSDARKRPADDAPAAKPSKADDDADDSDEGGDAGEPEERDEAIGQPGEWTVVEDPLAPAAADAASHLPLGGSIGGSTAGMTASEAFTHARMLKRQQLEAARNAAAPARTPGAAPTTGSAALEQLVGDDDGDGEDVESFRFVEKRAVLDDDDAAAAALPGSAAGPADPDAPAPALAGAMFKKRKVAAASNRRTKLE